jgi:hypothetical protein
MYPHERSLVKKLAGKPFALLGVNSDADRETLPEIIKKEQITWRSWADGRNGPIAKAWHIEAWPTVYVLDANGIIRHRNLPGEILATAVEALLEESREARPSR